MILLTRINIFHILLIHVGITNIKFKDIGLVKNCILYAKIMLSQKSFEQITGLSLP